MQFMMAEFVSDEERTLDFVAALIAADSATLLVVESAYSFQFGIARFEPRNLYVQVCCCRQHELQGAERIGSVRYHCLVERCGLDSDWLERVHALEIQ